MVLQATNGRVRQLVPDKKYWGRCLRRVDWGGAFPIVPVDFDAEGRFKPKAKMARELVYPNWTSYHYLRWLEKDIEFEGYAFAIGSAPLVVLDVDERSGEPSRLESLRRLFELAGDDSLESRPYVSSFRGGAFPLWTIRFCRFILLRSLARQMFVLFPPSHQVFLATLVMILMPS